MLVRLGKGLGEPSQLSNAEELKRSPPPADRTLAWYPTRSDGNLALDRQKQARSTEPAALSEPVTEANYAVG